MSKRLDITPGIADAISRSTGGSVEPNGVAVFETISMNTLPIKKHGTIFHRAVATESLMQEMAQFTNKEDAFLPLHVMHDQGKALPVGRVFEAEVNQNDSGITELRSLFYLPLSEKTLIEKIETGAVEEVSVGVQPLHLNCSECGFDYRGPEATMDNIFTMTCANDHVIGVNGTHLNMAGLDTYYELSLVARGAANGAKIQTRTRALMGKDKYAEQLAATSVLPESTILFASPTPKEPVMDMKELIADLTSAKADKQVLEAAVKKADETIAALTAENEALKKTNAELTAKTDPAVADLQKSLEETTASLAAAVAVVRLEADRLSVGTATEKLPEGATVAQLSERIQSARAKLADSIPVGGVALSSEVEQGTQRSNPQASSFKLSTGA